MKEFKYYTPLEIRQLIKLEVGNRLDYIFKEISKLKREIKKFK